MEEGEDSCDKILKTIEKIVDNNLEMPHMIIDITSSYIEDKRRDYPGNAREQTLLEQIRLTCRKYNETMKYGGDDRILYKIKCGYSNLIYWLSKGYTTLDMLNHYEDILEQSGDEGPQGIA